MPKGGQKYSVIGSHWNHPLSGVPSGLFINARAMLIIFLVFSFSDYRQVGNGHRQEQGLCSQMTQVQIPPLSLSGCVTLCHCLTSLFQLSYFNNRIKNKTSLIEIAQSTLIHNCSYVCGCYYCYFIIIKIITIVISVVLEVFFKWGPLKIFQARTREF